jgi:hypothetical protein
VHDSSHTQKLKAANTRCLHTILCILCRQVCKITNVQETTSSLSSTLKSTWTSSRGLLEDMAETHPHLPSRIIWQSCSYITGKSCGHGRMERNHGHSKLTFLISRYFLWCWISPSQDDHDLLSGKVSYHIMDAGVFFLHASSWDNT